VSAVLSGEKLPRWSDLPRYEGRCCQYLVQVPSHRIGYVNAILESYEVVAKVQTDDTPAGILRMIVQAEWDGLFQDIMGRLAKEMAVSFLKWER